MTRVKLHPHPKAPGFYVAHVSVPMVVGDVPGSNRVTCIADTKSGALAAAASLAQQIAMDPTIGAVIPEGTYDDMEALKRLATSTRAGISALKACAHLMPSQRPLARILADEARTYGDATSVDVAGFFDDLRSLASKVVDSVVDYADPDHWPKWMKNIAKPMSRVALDAAATAVLGPAGPAVVETVMATADKAAAGDPKAQKAIEDLAHKALDGDKKSKLMMSAVRAAADDNAKAVGDAADDYMAQYGAAFDPATWAGMDNTGYGDNTAPSPYGDNTAAMLSPQDVYALQQAAAYGQPGSTQPYGYGPQMPPQYGPSPYGYGYDDGYEQDQPQQAPQLNADGTMWWNADHWERVPAGGLPGMDASQPAGYDPTGWPVDPSGQPWPQDQNGQPMDPSQMPPASAQQDPGVGPAVRAHAAATRGVGPRGGGVTVTARPGRGGGPGFGGGARDSRGSSQNAAKNGGLWAAFNHSPGAKPGGGGRDHRGR